MAKRYAVALNGRERQELERRVRSGRESARVLAPGAGTAQVRRRARVKRKRLYPTIEVS